MVALYGLDAVTEACGAALNERVASSARVVNLLHRAATNEDRDRTTVAQRSEVVSEQMARTPGPNLQEIIPMKAIVVTDQVAGTAGMKLVERPQPQGAALASLSGANYGDVLFRSMRQDSPEMSWRGPRPGSIVSAVTDAFDPRPRVGRSGHRPQLWNDGLSVDSGCSASRTGRATARWRICSRRGSQPRAAAGDVDFTVGAALVMPA